MLAKPKVLTVSELNRDLKEVLESVFQEVWVEGEISNLRQPASGHLYFSLKDASSQIRCVLFRNDSMKIRFSLKDGLQAVVSGRVSVYERDGQYQFYVRTLDPKGKGGLQLAFEQLKEKLAKEGLFDEARKRPLPFLPQTIGVVTSPTGAVIRDILHVLGRRFPSVHILIDPVRVQGDGASQEIVRAIEELNGLGDVDVIILARGGGSLEDLWCFNEEAVARAIFHSRIPVISAIGHETDYTISDFVADMRAPTPSAAAEIVMPSRLELEEKIRRSLDLLARALDDLVPQNVQRVDDAKEDLGRALVQRFENERIRLEGLFQQLNALNPLSILKRGYSITSLDAGGKALLSTRGLEVGARVQTRLSCGTFVSEVSEIIEA